jgi:hypothetical protein
MPLYLIDIFYMLHWINRENSQQLDLWENFMLNYKNLLYCVNQENKGQCCKYINSNRRVIITWKSNYEGVLLLEKVEFNFDKRMCKPPYAVVNMQPIISYGLFCFFFFFSSKMVQLISEPLSMDQFRFFMYRFSSMPV